MNYKRLLIKLDILGHFIWKTLFILIGLVSLIAFVLLIIKGLNFYAKFY